MLTLLYEMHADFVAAAVRDPEGMLTLLYEMHADFVDFVVRDAC